MVEARGPEEAAKLAGALFFDCDRVERLTGLPGEGGTFLTTRAAAGCAIDPGARFLVVGPSRTATDGAQAGRPKRFASI
jgi:hypothetical protein